MNYKCLDCSHIFEEDEILHWRERHGLECGPYEEMTGCPLCRGAFEPAERCSRCGGVFLEDELYPGGLCLECIRESITPDLAAQYVSSRKIEADFYVRYWYGCGNLTDEEMGRLSVMLLNVLKKDFMQGKWFAEPKGRCVNYIMYQPDGRLDESGITDYAEWLEEISGKENANDQTRGV